MRACLNLLFPIVALLLAMQTSAQNPLPVINRFSYHQPDSLHCALLQPHLLNPYDPSAANRSGSKRQQHAPAAFLRPITSVSAGSLTQPQCQDTSVRLSFGQQDYYMYTYSATRISDGNMLIPTLTENLNSPFTGYAQLIKCTLMGDTIWSRKITSGYVGKLTYFTRAFELADKSILLTGNLGVPTLINGRSDFLMAKMDAGGNLIWQKTFSCTLWSQDTTNGSTDVYSYAQDTSGNIYLCGNVNASFDRFGFVLKIDTDGNLLWSKGFTIYSSPSFTGIDVVGTDTVKIFGNASNEAATMQFGIALNALTGDTLFSKAWAPAGTNGQWHSFIANGCIKLNNGNYAIYGPAFAGAPSPDGTELPTHYGITELSPSFSFVGATLFQSQLQSSSNNIISVFKDGSAAYERVAPYTPGLREMIIGSWQNGQVTKERVLNYDNASPDWTTDFLQLDDKGQLAVNEYSKENSNTVSIELMRLHSSDTSGSCLGNDTLTTIVKPLQLFPARLSVKEISSDIWFPKAHPLGGVEGNPFQITSNCRQISSCDSLKLIPSFTTLCPGTAASITIRKNKACGAFPAFNYDTTAVQSFYRVSDTTVSLTFRKEYKGYITAAINGCQPLSDSVQFTVLQSPATLNLGPDTVICTGNTIRLNAKSGYASYRWQDGSTDSLYTITKPGTYYVTAVNACGGSVSDTVVAAAHPPIPFNIGPDILLCAGSYIGITAPNGFIHYQWSPFSGISDTVGQMATFTPLQDTHYTITVEQTPGCFASDSFTIFVTPIPLIHLGNDTSLCAGQSLLLSAGEGFATYAWSTGAVSPSITVSTPGTFSVQATDNGCTAADTLQIKEVYPLPVFSLGNDTTLCTNQSLQYSFSFPQAVYNWSNGSSANTQTITQPGVYWLNISQNNCPYADTVQVSYQPSPVFSLGNDTTVCDGITVLLQASVPGASYRWGDGSTGNSYQISKGGLYTLTAAVDNCSTTDSITIQYKPIPYFNLGKDTFICLGQQFLLQPMLNTPVSYAWQNSSAAPSYTVTGSGTYYLTTIGDCGSYTDSIAVTTGTCKLVMPGAFTPGNNGVNNIFRVKYPFPARSFHMSIINRWGQKVFETDNISKGWNGMLNSSPASADTYIWQISYTDSEGKPGNASGTVVLIR